MGDGVVVGAAVVGGAVGALSPVHPAQVAKQSADS